MSRELEMPRLGLGTWKLSKKKCAASVRNAIEIGYRHIDTAQIYGNETEVGQGIQDAIEAGLVKREDIFLATKVWIDKLSPKKVPRSTDASLNRLQVDYVDLLYVHWPLMSYKPLKTLPAFSKLVDEGKTRYIGVSNFTIKQVNKAMNALDKPIYANQVEHHPLLHQDNLRQHMEKHDIKLVAYSPLARGKVMEMPPLQDIAQKYGITETQVSLAWILSHGAIAIPKATSMAHLIENFKAFQIKLDEVDLEKINDITLKKRLVNPFLRRDWDG